MNLSDEFGHTHTPDANCVYYRDEFGLYTLGCVTCGPQMVVTVNWDSNEVLIDWVHYRASITLRSNGDTVVSIRE